MSSFVASCCCHSYSCFRSLRMLESPHDEAYLTCRSCAVMVCVDLLNFYFLRLNASCCCADGNHFRVSSLNDTRVLVEILAQHYSGLDNIAEDGALSSDRIAVAAVVVVETGSDEDSEKMSVNIQNWLCCVIHCSCWCYDRTNDDGCCDGGDEHRTLGCCCWWMNDHCPVVDYDWSETRHYPLKYHCSDGGTKDSRSLHVANLEVDAVVSWS
mmetsp:Transcript_2064/g.7439  ORF Transcript_2064/g.7439 Transcript_2064/m.7439 type:complete len:212 (+) Transcript_2064:2239-2874(+)